MVTIYATLGVPLKDDDGNDWLEQAACKEAGWQAFFVPRGGSPQEAYSYCRRCPVRRECLLDAIAIEQKDYFGQVSGIRGGLSADTRRFIHYGKITVEAALARGVPPERKPKSRVEFQRLQRNKNR